MAHSIEFSLASQSARAHSDWYTILRSALITGLKSYGASVMVIAPPETIEAQTSIADSAPEICNPPVARPQPAIHIRALSQMQLAKPAWRNA
jgi:hypothetical protein